MLEPRLAISEAIRLGIYCRPIGSPRVGLGEALEVSGTCFWRVDATGERQLWVPEPSDLTLHWEIVSKKVIQNEYQSERELPW